MSPSPQQRPIQMETIRSPRRRCRAAALARSCQPRLLPSYLSRVRLWLIAVLVAVRAWRRIGPNRSPIIKTSVTSMNMQESFAFAQEIELADTAVHARSSWLGMSRTGFAARLKKWIDNYADSVVYEKLSHLSDTELKHRGLSRDILARDLGAERARHQL